MHEVFHVSLLKTYKDSGTVRPPPLELIDGEEEPDVNIIIAHRDSGGNKTKLLV